MSLRLLAKMFGDTPLYIVGGACRNMLLGFEPKDIDITAPLKAEDVIKLLDGSDFFVKPSSLRMGTLIICDGDNRYEYTAFRSDSYREESGEHKPLHVTFTRDINVDASRRDFRVNAIYYDILKEEYVDPLGGIEDLKNAVLRTTREPELVFGEDGLRLLRLVRFASELGFSVDAECYSVAKSLVHLLSDISVERITEEFNKILVADQRGYGNATGHIYGLRMLIDMGAMSYIIPELLEGDGVKQNPKYHKLDVMQHCLKAMEVSDASIRLSALLHDIGKPFELKTSGNMYKHNITGAIIVRNALTRLRYPSKVIDETSKLTEIHMFNINGDAKVRTIKKFILANHELMDKFLLLRWADATAGNGDLTSYIQIKAVYDEMLRTNTPLTLKDIAIDGKDLIALGYKGNEIGEKLGELLEAVALGDLPNDRDELIRQSRCRV